MAWNSVIGQMRVKNLLRSAMAGNRVPHAWLFTGPEGVGKDAMAIEVAKVLRCDAPLENGAVACDACRGCLSTSALKNANVRFVFALPGGKGEDARRDAPMLKLSDAEITLIHQQIVAKAADPYFNISIPKANQIKISSIREVRRDISFSAVEPGWRVVIVSEAHQMGDEAANAFLKTLEEPSSHTLLILTTSSQEGLLATIRSRCQEIRFDPLNEKEIAAALLERNGADRTNATLLSRLAEGSYSRAVELLSGDINALRYDVVTFFRAALRRSPLALHAEIERMTSAGDRAQVERMLKLLGLWLRDVYALRLTGSEESIVNRDQLRDIQSFNTKFASAPLEKMIDLTENAIHSVRRNAQIPLVLTVLGMRLEDICFQSLAVVPSRLSNTTP